MDNIINTINNEDLSLEELGEIVKKALAKIYSKLETDVGIRNPIGIINTLGNNSYDVDIVFISGDRGYSGESYENVYEL